jgi:hypothetical protein
LASTFLPDHTAAGEVELRLVATQKSGGLDVVIPKFNAGLPVGDHVLNWEFSATSSLFSCDMEHGGCPGTYGMKISVCELECELDTAKKHEGNAVLDQDSSHTFQVFAHAVSWLYCVCSGSEHQLLIDFIFSFRSTMAIRSGSVFYFASNKIAAVVILELETFQK